MISSDMLFSPGMLFFLLFLVDFATDLAHGRSCLTGSARLLHKQPRLPRISRPCPVGEVRYQDVYRANADRFVDLFARVKLGESIRATIKIMILGSSRGRTVNGDFAGEVLAGLGGARLEVGHFCKLEISQAMLWPLVGWCTRPHVQAITQ